jgi:dTDP-4-dehydrorhamnose reductase
VRALIFGASGQVGSALLATMPDAATAVGLDADSTDICDESAVRAALRDHEPDVVINCAAYTRVDDAEANEHAAMAVNGEAPRMMAGVARESGCRFLHLSTDYVFDGRGPAPYATDAATSPLNVYGATKLAGEVGALRENRDAAVVRTAWVHSGGASNFVATAVRVLGAGKSMHVVDDQIGTPTRARHLAVAIWKLAAHTELRGLLHFTDAGVASWYDVATAVLETMRACGRASGDVAVLPVSSGASPRAARRPACAVLDKHDSWHRLGYVPPHWRIGVDASTRELLNP